MKLKSFGCSFVYGSDLKDCPHGVNTHNPPPSKFTWPALLADRYGLEYQCHARPAASNLQILETVLSGIDPLENDIYVVNWTWIERFGFLSETASSGTHPWNPLGWSSILPNDSGPVAEIYYRHIHSQFRDKLETLMCIETAIHMLDLQGKKFLMTYTDDLIFETRWHTSPAITHLQKAVRPRLQTFEDHCLWDWVKLQGFDVSKKWHPLEAAHEAAADLMIPVIDTILHRA